MTTTTKTKTVKTKKVIGDKTNKVKLLVKTWNMVNKIVPPAFMNNFGIVYGFTRQLESEDNKIQTQFWTKVNQELREKRKKLESKKGKKHCNNTNQSVASTS